MPCGPAAPGQAGPVAGGPTRCIRCLLPNTIRSLGFSKEGICDVCVRQRANESGAVQREQEEPSLGEVIEETRQRGRGREFDCVIGLSGGRDSSYLAYLLTGKHGLRCLAAYYRTVFTPDATDRNVRRMYHATYLDGLLGNMVRAGQMRREEALGRLEGRPVFSPPRLQRVLRLLDLPDGFID